MLAALGILAALVNLYAAYDYLKEVVTGSAKPERSTMIIWFTTTAIVFITNIAEGAEESLWFAGSDFVLATLFLLASIKYGYGWVAKRDWGGLVVAAVGIVLWQTTGNAVIAMLAAVAVDAVGVALVAIKSLEAPETEPVRPWILYTVAGILAALSVGSLDWELLVFPIYVILSSPLLILTIKIGEKRAKNKPKTDRIKHKE